MRTRIKKYRNAENSLISRETKLKYAKCEWVASVNTLRVLLRISDCRAEELSFLGSYVRQLSVLVAVVHGGGVK